MSEVTNTPAAQIDSIMNTYQRFPVTFVKGKGSYIWDDTGKRYLDFTSGIGTCNLGHVPNSVKNAVEAQLQELWHCSNLYHIPAQQKLADLLTSNSFGDQVFFCNSGAEANEGAIKLARRYAQKVKGTDAFEVVTFQRSFHGRTMATLTATGQSKIQDGFGPLVPGFRYLPYNSVEALSEILTPQTCAVLLELTQGEGGVVPAKKDWLQQLVAICKENDILLMVDEVQTGMGRTGKLFAYEHYGIEPDVLTLAKGLGSGLPIGAIVAKGEVAEAFGPGTHGTTFGGNPIVATAGVATLTELVETDVVQQAGELGAYLADQLQELAEDYPAQVKEIRGIGLMQGIVTEGLAIDVLNEAREQHNVLLLVAGPNVVRLLPPLTTTQSEIDQVINVLKTIFANQTEGGKSL
ncbi:acetylornithine aminotransferase [Evansella vedderi]|uniref:Acetylornithine aminotransferase n=1 Tax=Evansella vedderi TaxID=38282 RepID=A0ABU0A1G3_9BACI|nr:acetylornithine transaminase [Evansella vedderi]MDQ0256959.1 acetylornithine aminotransferase [Evansella vedderi]